MREHQLTPGTFRPQAAPRPPSPARARQWPSVAGAERAGVRVITDLANRPLDQHVEP